MITQFSQVLNTQKLCVGAGGYPRPFCACHRARRMRARAGVQRMRACRLRKFLPFPPDREFYQSVGAGAETRPYKKQLRPMSGGPSCFYYEVKATICCAPVRTAIRSARRPVSVPQIEASRFRPLKGKHISRYLREFGARRVPSSLPPSFACGKSHLPRQREENDEAHSRCRVKIVKAQSNRLRDSVHAGACRGFPTPKQSPGLFRLPSCAFVEKEISLRARSDQRRCLWILPPLKRRAKFYFRADGLQRHSAFFARPKVSVIPTIEIQQSCFRVRQAKK